MIHAPGRLPFEQDDRWHVAGRPAPVNPHVRLLAFHDLPVIDAHDFDRCFIRMDDFAVIYPFMQTVIQKGEIGFSGLDHPVRHRIGGKIDPVGLEYPGLPVQRHGVRVLGVHDCKRQALFYTVGVRTKSWTK